jgi:hypothetical protein
VMQAAMDLSYELGYRPGALELTREAIG